jgi:hypothetical protein
MSHVNSGGRPRSEQDLADYELARNPKPGTKIYRAYGGDEGTDATVGIHWSTSRHVAESFPHSTIHEAVIDDPKGQVVPWAALNSAQFGAGDDAPFRTNSPRNVMGYDWENEVRLRPGARIRMAGGEERVVEHRGFTNYSNLYQHAVPGTPQARQTQDEAFAGPLVQESLFSDMTSSDTGDKVLGYVPKLEHREGEFEEQLDATMKDIDNVARQNGMDPDTVFLSGNSNLDVKIPATRDSEQKFKAY